VTTDVVAPVTGYEDLFRRHFDGLVRLAALLGADDPGDVAQEAFVRLHRRGALRDDNAALPYLRRTVANLARSRLRHLRVARRHEAAARPEHVPSAEDAAVRSDERRRLLAALDLLTHRQRELLVLRYWSGLSGPEIASTLGVPLGTVKSQTSRALDALAELMEPR
jgi:RNA polymerase sigma-70 factor (sigma-E family)